MIEGNIDQSQLNTILRRLKNVDPKNRTSIFVKGFAQATQTVERKLKDNVSNKIVNVRSGHLRNSIQSKVVRATGNLLSVIGSNVRFGNRLKYASILEIGGTITAKNAKYLTIPLPSALTPTGQLKKKAREWDNTFVKRSKAGNLIIYQHNGKGKITPLFVLKKSVKINARRYMEKTMKQMKNRVIMTLRGAIERGLAKEGA